MVFSTIHPAIAQQGRNCVLRPKLVQPRGRGTGHGVLYEKEHQRFLQQVTEFEHMLYEDGVTLIKFWFSISKEEQQQRFEA